MFLGAGGDADHPVAFLQVGKSESDGAGIEVGGYDLAPAADEMAQDVADGPGAGADLPGVQRLTSPGNDTGGRSGMLAPAVAAALIATLALSLARRTRQARRALVRTDGTVVVEPHR